MTQRLLLLGSSVVHGSGYLDHAALQIADLLEKGTRVLFVPHALFDRDAYAGKARSRFASMGYELDSLHEAPESVGAVREADALFIGGGNTFRLLAALYTLDLIDAIRDRVAGGMPYIGSSAGSNVACPTIGTTKDMPIVEPRSLRALSLVPFQISPHFQDPEPASTHKGETQEERIVQFLEENSRPVVGLREGAMLRVRDGSVTLAGTAGARIFRRGHEPVETLPPTALDRFLESQPEAP